MLHGYTKCYDSLPLIGVNTFLPKDHGCEIVAVIELIRSTEEEKGQRIANVKRYGEVRNALMSDPRLQRFEAPARSGCFILNLRSYSHVAVA